MDWGGGDVLEGVSFGRWHGLQLGCYLRIGREKKKKKNWQRKAGGPRLGIRVGLRGEGPGQAGYGVQETRGVSMFVDFSRRPPGAG